MKYCPINEKIITENKGNTNKQETNIIEEFATINDDKEINVIVEPFIKMLKTKVNKLIIKKTIKILMKLI